MRRGWAPLIALLVITAVMPACAQVISRKLSQEAMSLELDNAVAKRLAGIEQLIANEQWDALATLLRQTQVEKPDKLIPISDDWYVSVLRYCQCQAALLPTPGLTAYRQQVDPIAQKWFEEADRQLGFPLSQRAAWRRIIQQAFASSSAPDALARLAEQSFEQAEYAAARTYWEMLLPSSTRLRTTAGQGLLRQPSLPTNAAQIRAQLILCSYYEGDVQRANAEFAAFQNLHGHATGHLSGREGPLDQLLLPLIEKRRAEPARANSAGAIDRRVWSASLAAPEWAQKRASAEAESGDDFPIVVGSSLFVTNGESIFAFDAATGNARWSERSVTVDDARAAVIHSLADPIAPKLPVIGRPVNSLSICGNRLYARLGTPVTARAKQEMHSQSEIVGLDIGEGEGKLVWRVTAEEIEPEDPLNESSPWCFEGSPVATSKNIFVVLRRSLPQQQINIACFDADTARLVWNRKIGVTVVSTDEAANSTSHLQLTLAEDSVFLATDAGSIAALEIHDGTIRWVRTYPSETVLGSRYLKRNGHTPTVYHDGVLYAAPLDSNLIMAIHAESGLLLWQSEWPDPVQFILGISNDTLIVQGRSLWGVSVSTGRPAWPNRRVGSDDPESYSFGRGSLVDDEIWWPTREQLVVVAANSGRIKHRLEIGESLGATGGNLSVFGHSIAICHGNQLTVLGEDR